MRILTDVNVLLALVHGQNENHRQAVRWLDGVVDDTICICRMTQNGLLRLLTLAPVMQNNALTMGEAWQVYDRLMTDERFTFALEPDGLERVWRALCPSKRVSPKMWMDAYLAAFAIAEGAQLVTFDRGFREFRGLALHVLGAQALREESISYTVTTGA
jgi:toxin-antitoxin system PIN domain toxin